MLVREANEGLGMLRFSQALTASRSLEELERVFVTGFPKLFDVPIYGFNVCEPATLRREYVVCPTVSDVFVERYRRELWDTDPLRTTAIETGDVVYNLDLMSAEEWEESLPFRRVFSLHGMRHVLEAPMIEGGALMGNLHFATSHPEQDFGPSDLKVAKALGEVVAVAIKGIRRRERVERERDHLLRAFDLTRTAIVLSEPQALQLRVNDAAEHLLADVVDGEAQLHKLLARPPGSPRGGFSRRVDVELHGGEGGTLHAHSNPTGGEPAGLIAVLELRRERATVAPELVAALTAREAEVAVLVSEGLADREIAAQLKLSSHTVSQYVKRIYRKLEVDSRVFLTRLLLGVD